MSIRLYVAGLLIGASLCLANPLTEKERQIRDEQSRFDPFHNECEINEDDRLQCGPKTFNELECVSRGCCFQPCEGCAAEIPWCFAAKRMLRAECAVSYENKDDCGYYGITEGECATSRGCCWRPSHLPNDPYCFYPLSLRIVDGPTQDSGRVEIRHDGEWGTVCDDDFGQPEADVVCRALGYSYAKARGYAHYGAGRGPIWMDGIRCTGDEERLEDCPHNGWGTHNCGHSEDSSVDCSHEPFEGPEPPTYYSGYFPYDDIYYDDEDTYRSRGRNGFSGKPGKREVKSLIDRVARQP